MLIRQGEKIVFFGDSLTQRTDLNESEHPGAAVQPGLCRKLCGHSGQAAPDSFSAVGVYLL